MEEYAPGLSVCMIARNAEQYLNLALRSLREAADEIVLVDTGSTDATLDIARSHDCRIFHFPWCDDFARAKNHALEQARFRWILNVDADEVLFDRKGATLLAAALEAGDVPAYVIWVDNAFEGGRTESARILRLFRNDPRIRFTNPVHESIGESLYRHWPRFVPPVLDLHLKHYGYLPANARGKHHRNAQLLRRWAEAEPANIYANYKLGGTLVEAGEREEALPFLGRAFELLAASGVRESYPFLRAFLDLYLGALEGAGRHDEAGERRRRAAGWSERSSL